MDSFLGKGFDRSMNMPLPLPNEMESMAFMAVMDGLSATSLACSCPTCKGDRKGKPNVRGPLPPTRRTPQSESTKTTHIHEAHSSNCIHHHALPSRQNPTSTKKPTTTPHAQTTTSTIDAAAAPSNVQGRESKVNVLLKALTEKPIFDILNLTPATAEEKNLVQLIQDSTKSSKLYSEVKDKVMEICDDEDVDLDAVFGVLAKFRHERNLLITAMLKSNGEREAANTEKEKTLLCIKRVDDLMYMLQEAAKRPKDADSDMFMHKLSGIILEVHDLAKSPSILWEELLEIREEHFHLVDDHAEMHEKFMDVNSCHDKLHTNHDKLQKSHNKLKEEHSEIRKKASQAGGLKSDIARLEKIVERHQDENTDLRKEVERLAAELAKANSLKHENAQLKKKVTTLLTSQPQVPETAATNLAPAAVVHTATPGPTSSTQAGKKKKGKKGQNTIPVMDPIEEPSASIPKPDSTEPSTSKADEEVKKLKKSHDALTKELGSLRESLAQLELLRKRAENNKEDTMEKLQLEQAKCQNWQEIAHGHAAGKEQMQGQLERLQQLASKLQGTIDSLEKNLAHVKADLLRQKEAHSKVKAELDERCRTPAMSEPTSVLGQDSIRILHKIKTEISQLLGNLDEAQTYGGDIHVLLNIITITVRDVVEAVGRDVDEVLNSKNCSGSAAHVPETIMPIIYGQASLSRNAPHLQQIYASRSDYSPQESPSLPFPSNVVPLNPGVPSYRPLIPPGFGEPSPATSSGYGFPRAESSTLGSRAFNVTPSSTSSLPHISPGPLQPMNANISHGPGPIGTRPTNLSATKVGIAKQQAIPSPIGTPAPSTTSGVGGLGNGAAGVDWSMWSKPAK